MASPVAAQETMVVTTTADSGEGSLRAALAQAAEQNAPVTIVIFAEGDIVIDDTLSYTGHAPLSLFGNATRITSQADVTLLASTGGADLYMRNILLDGPGGWDLENRNTGPAGKGLFVGLRDDQSGTLSIELQNVRVSGTAGHGIHVSDCLRADACGRANDGSAASILLRLNAVEVLGAGRGVFDADGLRVDERGAGGITVFLDNARFAENGADGIELDEGQAGDVVLRSSGSAFELNGDYCDPERLADFRPDPPEAAFAPGAMAEDAIPGPVSGAPDDACISGEVALHADGSVSDYGFVIETKDGMRIRESGPGSILSLIERAGVIGNFDQGLDFVETAEGDIRSTLIGTFARDNADDAYRHSEEGPGSVVGSLVGAVADGNGGRGVVFGEAGQGDLRITGYRVRTQFNNGEGPGLKVLQADEGTGVVNLGQSQISDGVEREGAEVTLDE